MSTNLRDRLRRRVTRDNRYTSLCLFILNQTSLISVIIFILQLALGALVKHKQTRTLEVHYYYYYSIYYFLIVMGKYEVLIALMHLRTGFFKFLFPISAAIAFMF